MRYFILIVSILLTTNIYSQQNVKVTTSYHSDFVFDKTSISMTIEKAFEDNEYNVVSKDYDYAVSFYFTGSYSKEYQLWVLSYFFIIYYREEDKLTTLEPGFILAEKKDTIEKIFNQSLRNIIYDIIQLF